MTFDLAPFLRGAIGLESAFARAQSAYPPRNITKHADGTYTLTLVVAGFAPEEIEVIAQNDKLVIKGIKAKVREEDEKAEYVHRDFTLRDFERHFALLSHVEIQNAKLANGLLEISLKQVIPDALKPRRIPINAQTD